MTKEHAPGPKVPQLQQMVLKMPEVKFKHELCTAISDLLNWKLSTFSWLSWYCGRRRSFDARSQNVS